MLCASWVHNKFWPLWWRISLSIRVQTTLFKPLSICFLPQYSTPKKVFISERDQNHDSKKEQALSITFLQYDWFIFKNERSWLAITLRDKKTRAWRVQRCLDSHRERQISQSDCEITSNWGKTQIAVTLPVYLQSVWINSLTKKGLPGFTFTDMPLSYNPLKVCTRSCRSHEKASLYGLTLNCWPLTLVSVIRSNLGGNRPGGPLCML